VKVGLRIQSGVDSRTRSHQHENRAALPTDLKTNIESILDLHFCYTFIRNRSKGQI